MKLHFFWLICLLLITSSVTSQISNPQKMLEGKMIRKTNQAIDKKTDEAIDSLLNDKTKPADNHQNSETKQVQTTQTDSTATIPQNQEPVLQTYSKFDFVAGERVIFFDDFSQGNVGDFPVCGIPMALPKSSPAICFRANGCRLFHGMLSGLMRCSICQKTIRLNLTLFL